MAISKTLQRLLRVLDMKEESRRKELGLAQSELAAFERARQAAGKREQVGRRHTARGVEHADLRDRLAGVEEMAAGRRHALALEPYIAQAAIKVEELRTAYLDARVEQQQTETLVTEAQAREAAESERRTQRNLDDIYLARHANEQTKADRQLETPRQGAAEDSDYGRRLPSA